MKIEILVRSCVRGRLGRLTTSMQAGRRFPPSNYSMTRFYELIGAASVCPARWRRQTNIAARLIGSYDLGSFLRC